MDSDNIVELALNKEPQYPDRQPQGYHSYSPHHGRHEGEDDMLQRVKTLEKDMQHVKTDLAVIRSNYATTSSVSDAKTAIILWTVGTVALAQLVPAIPKMLNALFSL